MYFVRFVFTVEADKPAQPAQPTRPVQSAKRTGGKPKASATVSKPPPGSDIVLEIPAGKWLAF